MPRDMLRAADECHYIHADDDATCAMLRRYKHYAAICAMLRHYAAFSKMMITLKILMLLRADYAFCLKMPAR